MAELALHVLGIRHHGPGSARMVQRALKHLKPDAVLIEGPPDAAEMIGLAGHKGMKPPVALLVYEPDAPSEAVYYPFATFSPEWQAIQFAATGRSKTSIQVRFIDLPQSLRPRRAVPLVEPAPKAPADAEEGDAATAERPPADPDPDPLNALALAAGYADGEVWWNRLIEERRGEEDPAGSFDAIREAMASARKELGHTRHDPQEALREAHMRTCIRAAVGEGFERIAVVCGAWHAPVLTTEALTEFSAKADDHLLKGLTKRKTAATWIPWTYDRLAFDSGYGAGVASPGWYEHLWLHHEGVSENWLTKVARLMRAEGLDASPASVIEAVRLSESLASLRGRSIAGLDELGEATLAILCHGNPMPMKVIERKLVVGQRLGEVPEEAPAVPLQRDIASLQKSLRLKVSADEADLDLDQRKETDLARSRFLHRLSLLDIPWGTLQADQRQRTSTFHEVWKLQWKPEFAVAVIVAARWGNTVFDAASAFVADKALHAPALSELTEMLDHVMLADLASAVDRVVSRIEHLSAVASDLGHLMDALPPLARVLRYGNVRKTDAALVEPVVAGLLARICIGLLPACASLDDEAAAATRIRLDAVDSALTTLDRADFLEEWRAALRKTGDADIHGLVAGRAWRLLLDSGTSPADDASDRLSLALSRGNDPEKAASWLEGFLGGSGMVLVHDDHLLGLVDQWVTSLSRDAFEQLCPIVRRTFSEFEKPERRQIGEKIKRGSRISAAKPAAPSAATSAPGDGSDDTYDAARGALVDPVLRLILGDRMP